MMADGSARRRLALWAVEHPTVSQAGAVEAAEALALTALACLLEDADRSSRFLGISGLAGTDLAAQLHDPGFLGGVLDFVLGDETLLAQAATAAGIRPERVRGMRQHLPGAPPNG